jgi:putative ABC transport system permease protein
MMTFRLPLRFLRGQYGRRMLTVVALALGVALVFAVDIVTSSMQRAFDEVIDTMAGRAALEVRAGTSGLVPEDVVELVRGVPGVEIAVPVVSGTAFLTDGSGESVTVHGVDLLNESHLRVYRADGDDAPVDDPIRFLADPRSVVLTKSFAARHGLESGDSIELSTPRGKRLLSILSLLEPQGVARVYGGNLVVMDVTAAQELFAAPGLVSRIDLVVARGTSVDDVRSAIAALLPEGLAVSTPAQRKVDLQAVMRSFQLLLRAIGVVGLVIAFLIAFNGLSWEFERRAWQLGILSAIGVRRSVIWRAQMMEALLLGIVGAALGSALGMILAYALLPVLTTATALNFNVIAPEATLAPSVASVGVAIALGVGTAVLAGWLPAARAVRLGSASTIRGRAVEVEPVTLRTRLWIVAALALSTLVAVIVQSQFGFVAAGLLATALVVVTIAVLATPLVQLAARALLPLLTRWGGASGRFAGTALRDHPRRVGMSVATIAVGVGVVLWLGVLAQSFEASVVDALGRAIRADVVVTSANVAGGFLEAPMSAEVLDEVRGMEGVAAVSGWRAIEWPYDGGPIGLSAYDDTYFVDRRFGEWPLQAGDASAWAAVARGEAVVVSTSFVTTTGKSVGDRLVLESPSGPVELPIAGVTVDFVSPRGTIEISRALYSERWRDLSLTRIFVVKQRTTAGAELRRRIAAGIGERFELRVLSAAELLEYFRDQVRRAFGLIPILAALVFGVILVGLGQSLATSVLDRRRDLATAHAIGLRAGCVRRSVILESALVGGIGLGLAGIGGAVLAWLWVGSTFRLLLGWALDVHLPHVELLAIAVLTMLVALLSSWLPARAAERLSVTEILRSE